MENLNDTELMAQDSREIEEADFSAFRLQDEDTREALDDLRLGWGTHRDAGMSFSSFDDGEGLEGGAEYVPAWA